MQTQNQNQTTVNILDQFSEMLKTHSIVVSDRDNLLKLFENIVDLCTQMPKTKLKAAIKAATPKPLTTATEAKTKKPTAAAAKKKAVAVIADDKLVGPDDAGDCPVLSDLPKVTSRGRGRPRKEPSASPASSVQTESSVNEAEKKKRGRPKKDKTVVVSSNDDEDQLIANMISDMKALQRSEDANTPVHIADPDDDESSNESSVSPIHSEITHQAVHPAEVETDVTETDVTEANSKKTKKAKEPKAPKAKAPKEPKAKETKESKAKAPKESKESKESKAPKESKATEPEPAPAPAPAAPAPAELIAPAPASAVPPRENRAQSDGKFYLMHNCPRKSSTYNGATYLRTETDNVYDQLTLELIGVWDHLNHEIITAYDEEDDIWMSDEE